MKRIAIAMKFCLLSLAQCSFGQQSAVSLPLRRLRLTSSFGYRIHPMTGGLKFHNGIDLYARSDTVFSVMGGFVTKVANDPVAGNYVMIGHTFGLQTIYGHLSAIAVMPGDSISAGQPIAITGATGRVTGEHLHFAVRYQDHWLPPLQFLAGLLR